MGMSSQTPQIVRKPAAPTPARDYHSTLYQIFPQTNVVVQFHVGKACPVLDAFLESQAVEYGVLVTAYNPHGLNQPAINNTIAHHQLTALLKSEFWEFFPAGSGDPAQPELTEPGVFILNMDMAEGSDLARRFAQDAFIQIVKGHPPTLIWPEKPPLN